MRENAPTVIAVPSFLPTVLLLVAVLVAVVAMIMTMVIITIRLSRDATGIKSFIFILSFSFTT